MEPPGIEPTSAAQSREVTRGRPEVASPLRAEVRGTPSAENVRAMNACELPPGFDGLSDTELRGAAKALISCESYRVAQVLLAELERREVEREHGNVIRLRQDGGA